MSTDPLSDILAAFDPQSRLSGGVIAGGDWAIRFAAPQAIKFGAVLRGTCWHVVEGRGAPVRLQEGDVFVVNGRHPLRLASDPALTPVEAESVFAGTGMAHLGQGEDFRLLGGHVALDPAGTALMAEVLPPFLQVAARSPAAGTLRWLLDRLVAEGAARRPGHEAIARPLAHLLFLEVLRARIEAGDLGTGWLAAAGDPRLGPAMGLMHADPARAWHLDELARAAGMSRSGFAERFRAVSGMTPLGYLTFWRMRLAERALAAGAPSLAPLAARLGYASESAFSTAFKRVVGVAPAHYRRAASTGQS